MAAGDAMTVAISQLSRAADRCPYHRLLDEGFDGCPAFVARSYQTVDFERRPTRPVPTCAHLTVGTGESAGHYYPRCTLGTAAERDRWVEAVSPELLQRLRALSAEYRRWVAPRMPALWQLKARYLSAAATHDLDATETARTELKAAVDRLLVEVSGFLRDHAAELRKVELSSESVATVLRTATEHWAFADRSADRYEVPDELLSALPPRLRLYITSGRAAPEPGRRS